MTMLDDINAMASSMGLDVATRGEFLVFSTNLTFYASFDMRGVDRPGIGDIIRETLSISAWREWLHQGTRPTVRSVSKFYGLDIIEDKPDFIWIDPVYSMELYAGSWIGSMGMIDPSRRKPSFFSKSDALEHMILGIGKYHIPSHIKGNTTLEEINGR